MEQLKNIKKLDLSQNKISKIEFPQGSFENLRTINITNNQLTSLPDGIIRCLKLQKLYACYNKLTFTGESIAH